MAVVSGAFQNTTIRDTRGTTNNLVTGYGNTARFVGDSGRNTFNVQGGGHNVTVNNLGRDDTVNLSDPGWQELPDSNSRDGRVRYYNTITKSYAEVRTDGGRNDNFVRARVNTNKAHYCPWQQMVQGPWSGLGHLNPGNTLSWADGYLAGMNDGYRAGRARGRLEQSPWLSFAALALGWAI